MMTTEIAAPSHASRLTPAVRNTIAATSVDAEMTESSRASWPESTRLSELTCSPTRLKYVPSTTLTAMAAPTTTSAGVE